MDVLYMVSDGVLSSKRLHEFKRLRMSTTSTGKAASYSFIIIVIKIVGVEWEQMESKATICNLNKKSRMCEEMRQSLLERYFTAKLTNTIRVCYYEDYILRAHCQS